MTPWGAAFLVGPAVSVAPSVERLETAEHRADRGAAARELEDGTSITKYGASGTLQSCDVCASNNTTNSTPTLTADLLGDWREEVIWREADNSALRLYTTTALTERRLYTLMHDPQYRMQVSGEQTAYNQPPHVGFHIGSGMVTPPQPDIHLP